MIIEIPRGYTFIKDESIIAFEDNGILKIYGRSGKFQDVMYDLTYQLKGRNKCYYCGTVVESPKKMTLDHIYPVSLGDPTIPINLVPSCRKCSSNILIASRRRYFSIVFYFFKKVTVLFCWKIDRDNFDRIVVFVLL